MWRILRRKVLCYWKSKHSKSFFLLVGFGGQKVSNLSIFVPKISQFDFRSHYCTKNFLKLSLEAIFVLRTYRKRKMRSLRFFAPLQRVLIPFSIQVRSYIVWHRTKNQEQKIGLSTLFNVLLLLYNKDRIQRHSNVKYNIFLAV